MCFQALPLDRNVSRSTEEFSLDLLLRLRVQVSRQEVEEPELLSCHATLTKDTLPAAVTNTEWYLNKKNPRNADSGMTANSSATSNGLEPCC